MNTPRVSIIIPAYNAGKYVKEAVDSALAQTYKDIEVIVVDDGSTDGTRKILEPYISGGKIKYLRQANKGLSGARNMGIRNAKGEYIALLDADDAFSPEKIEKQVAHLKANPACDVSYCGLYHFWDEEPDKLFKLDYKYYSGKDVLPNLLKRSFIAPVTVVFRRAVFDRYGFFSERIKQFAEDWELWLRLAYGGAQICFLPEILAKLRLRREGNIQGLSRQPEMKLTALEVLEGLNERMSPEERIRYGMRQHLAKHRLKAAFAYLLVGQKASAKKFVAMTFRDYPLGRVFSTPLSALISAVPAVLLRRLATRIYYSKRSVLLRKV